ncbi:multiple epidermal growth factor-like domains protein 10 isoform X2 [Ostrea edulis]|uniref:multiple epidermal growth factor-like domains protein 10 isoform X2 n=1 Tax=Ostrea edulis TaxID=37623 RepID=UPI0024AEEB4C|nr:multiple epidermal growth factor-like domains protein 10 isoform X2 [Ostrea edulis]
MNVHLVNVLWLLSYSHPCVSAVVCEGLKGLTCCSGFAGHVWNETVHNCTRCMSGFHGEHCASSCPFPHYGIHCGLMCNCSEEECHHQYGCKRSFGDSSSPDAGPLAKTTTAYPLNEVNENFNTLAVEINSCIRTENVPPIKRNTATLQYAIIGLGCVCCVFLIFYIGLRIVLYRYKPKVWNRQGHEMQMDV